jgi:hypothetical protein
MPASDSFGNAEGLTTVPSQRGPKETMDRLEAELPAEAMTILARVDHAAGAVRIPWNPRARSVQHE